MAHDRTSGDASAPLTPAALRETWLTLIPQERLACFRRLSWADAETFFLSLSAHDQAEVINGLPLSEQRLWMRLLAPDDAVDVIQEAPPESRGDLLALLAAPIREEVMGLLEYDEQAAGGLMSPRFAHVRPDMRSREALAALRQQVKRQLDMPYYIYVLDREHRLLGVVSFRELFMGPTEAIVQEVMQSEVISVAEDQDQETVAAVIAQHDLLAVPVVDQEGRMKGIVTVDDVIDVVREEATEDIQKLAGMTALEMPYLRTGFLPLLKKRIGWLIVLFLGEMLTATAMGYYEQEIARAVVLALFVPLIISSGGNSGSQASTLMVRALALGEVRLRDWWRVLRRECLTGATMGAVLGSIGLIRILVWQGLFHTYGAHYVRVGLTVAMSLTGVVLWGTLAGSMLPFVLQRFGCDPASASAPFVATLVDVTGLVIYFSVASVVLL